MQNRFFLDEAKAKGAFLECPQLSVGIQDQGRVSPKEAHLKRVCVRSVSLCEYTPVVPTLINMSIMFA